MKTVHLLRGIPGSGKSSRAKILEDTKVLGGDTTVVNRDTIRYQMFGTYKTNKAQEKQVKLRRDYEIDSALMAGNHVVVDDTNLTTLDFYRNKYGKDHNVTVEFLTDSFDADLCHERNNARTRTVPASVVESMYLQFVKLYHKEVYGFDFPLNTPNGRPAIICDIDNTIATMGNRSPYDWKSVGLDEPKQTTIDLVRQYVIYLRYKLGSCDLIFLSGRDSSCEQETRDWLDRYFSDPIYHLFMRKEGDNRKDFIVKKEIYLKEIYGTYDVECVFDDRAQVVRLWNGFGLNVFQVYSNGKSNCF